METPRVKTALVGLALSVVFLAGAAYAQTYPEGLVLWNKLGSQTEVENSEVGLDGTFLGGGFAGGFFGNAFVADYTQDSLVRFPKEVIPVYAGCIEFWARLMDFPHVLPWAAAPIFVRIYDPDVGESYTMQLNGNDGTGDGGLCAWVGRGHCTGTGWWYEGWTYEQVLGSGQVENWHHYALVWDENGIPGVTGGTRKVALFLNGQLNSGRWEIFPPDDFVPLTSGELVLIWNILSQGSVAMDNIKVWDYSKTDFSDRFVEGFPIAIDIKPQSCPNPLNTKSRGVLPVAILGTEDFDVTAVDPATVTLEGVSPLRWANEDVATPVSPGGDVCDCTEEGPDGHMDMTLKFDTQEIVAALGAVTDGEYRPLTLMGETYDGIPIEGQDCVWIKDKGNDPAPPPVISVETFNGVATTIHLSLSEATEVTMVIYDVRGKQVRTIVNGTLPGGDHRIPWTGKDDADHSVANGVYFCRVKAGTVEQTVKMLLMD